MKHSNKALKLTYCGVYKQGDEFFYVSSEDTTSKPYKTEQEAKEKYYINEGKIHLRDSKVNIKKVSRAQLIEVGKHIDESFSIFRDIKN